MVLVFLAFAYLFVGLAHTVACIEQAVAATVVVEPPRPQMGSDDGPQKHSAAVADHCHVCASGVTPALDIAAQSAHSSTRVQTQLSQYATGAAR